MKVTVKREILHQIARRTVRNIGTVEERLSGGLGVDVRETARRIAEATALGPVELEVVD